MFRVPQLLASALLISSLAAGLGAEPRPEVVYGDDDRRDVYDVSDERVRAFAGSTVALIPASSLHPQPGRGKIVRIDTESYAESYGLCRSEPFYEQRTAAFCSGSLVGPDLVMTAGHCLRTQSDCEETRFVFGFALKGKGDSPDAAPKTDVYACAELLGRQQIDDGADWALVRLSRKVEGRKPLAINRTGKIVKGAPLFVIGHPAGLPTKVAGGAKVRDASPEGYFTAGLDTYGGNSGSAVFNAQTGLVEGILVRGEQDFVSRGDCNVSNVCGTEECRGEDVTKVSVIASKIPMVDLSEAGNGRVLKTLESAAR